MKKLNLFFTILFSISNLLLLAENAISPDNNTSMPAFENEQQEKILFSYTNEDLVSIINALAIKRNLNVILPQGPNAINAKLSMHVDQPVTLDEAWELLLTILEIAGYSAIPKKDMYEIIKKDKNLSRQPVPLYIGTNPADLPDSEERIRFIHYLANLKVSNQADNELNVVLKNILPADALFKGDNTTNALIITAKANEIRYAMQIIEQLDRVGFQEKMEMLILRNSRARMVADLINQNILKTTEQTSRYRLDTRKESDISYFSKHIKVIPEERLNALILLGRSQAVDRLKDFITTYIDAEIESGKSVLHVYQLQYLDADTFAPVLQKIVESSRTGGTGQAAAGEKAAGGTERFFDEVIIKVDRPAEAEEKRYYGGNKLIVAARNEDWKQIKKLIEELDTPQPQVLLEILIADLTLDDTRLLGALTRTPDKIPLPSNLEFQSAHIDPGIITDSFDNPTTLNADLLRLSADANGNQKDGGPNTVATLAAPGSTLISLADNDGETWSILQLLKLFTHSKILSHPHIIATNNRKAEIKIGESRNLIDEAKTSAGGATVQTLKQVEANLKVEITPRISTADTVNLQVLVDINDFISGSDAQTIRKVETNANIQSGSIFALGGLIRVDTTHSTNETPILSKVPVLGYFFKRRQGQVVKNNLTVFIQPTIIQPRLRAGVGEYTRDYINVAKNFSQEGKLFSGLKEPITRWFFKTGVDANEELDKFLAKDELQLDENHMIELAPPPPKVKETDQVDSTAEVAPVFVENDTDHAIEKLKELLEEDDNPFLQPQFVAMDDHLAEQIPNNIVAQIDKPKKRSGRKRNKKRSKKKKNTVIVENSTRSLRNLVKNDDNPFTKS